jgi:protein AIR1/2
VLPHLPDFPREPSAFSEYNIRSGPFFDLAAESAKKRVRSRKKRDWEVEGPEVPTEVGKRGRKKERARMEKIAREQDEGDEIDWFNNPRNVKNRGVQQTVRTKGKSVNIELAVKDGGKRFSGGQPPSSAPGLLARLSDRYDSPSSSSRQTKGYRERPRNRERYSNGHEDDDSRTRDQPRRSKDRPRWTGGYS